MEFIKYPKILRIGHEETKDVLTTDVVIQEKIDGGNFRFAFINGYLIFGTRTQQITSNEGEETNVNKMFKKCVDYVRDKVSDKIKNFDNLIFFGENCVKHTMTYDFENMPIFLGFDIYSFKENKFLEYKKTAKIFKSLDLEMVPTINEKIKLKIEDINDNLVPISKYALDSAKDRKAEGIVIKNYKKQIFAKYVRDVFKEKNAEAFGGNPKYNKVDDTNNSDFVFKYCTNARIEKIIYKYLEQGEKLDMTLMGKIIKQTYIDIIEEEWKEILTSNWKLDFKNIRKLIAPRCISVLTQMISLNKR